MRMNDQTKLVFALEHVAHIHDLIKDNEWEDYLKSNLLTVEYELERQLKKHQYNRNGRSKRLAQLDKLD
jgi:hypothetical protein